MSRAAGKPFLTPAERRVVVLLSQGLNQAAIADALRLSPPTIKSHLSRIATRWGITTSAGIVGQAYLTGLIHEPEPPPVHIDLEPADDKHAMSVQQKLVKATAAKEASAYAPEGKLPRRARLNGYVPPWMPEFPGDRRLASRDRRRGPRNRRARDDGES